MPLSPSALAAQSRTGTVPPPGQDTMPVVLLAGHAGQSSMASALWNVFKETLSRDFVLSHPRRRACRAETLRKASLEQPGKLN